MKQKLFTLFLVLVASVGIIYASDTQVDGIWYDFNESNKTATVTYRGSSSNYSNAYSGSVVIPPSVTYNGTTYSVTSIGNYAFSECSGLTSVTIPNSVTSIGEYAFHGCSSLTSITIPNSVTSIGYSAFSRCSSLTSVTIPNGVTSIGDRAFCYCSSLTSITIPNSVTSIGGGAFYGCKSLTSVHTTDLAAWCNIDFRNESANPLYFAHDLYLNGELVKNLVIPNSVTSIGDYAFVGCSSLTSVTIPNSVTSIGKEAFCGCSSLTSPVYNAHCFAYMPTSYSGVYAIPEGIKQIAGGAFYGCKSLTSVTIPNSVTSIGYRAFEGCSSLTSVTINSDAIVNKAYTSSSNLSDMFGSQVTKYIIGDNVKGIGDYAFAYCRSLTSVTIPNSVTSIGDYAFRECSSLSSVTIPNSVTSIGEWAISRCSSLTSVTIGNSVTSIGEYAFSGCDKLVDVYCYATTPPEINENSFSNYNAFLYIPCENKKAYMLDAVWGNFKYIECISSDNVTTDEIVISPSDNEVNVTWPTVSGAASYELVIKDKDGNIICTLIFNANGQLTSMAFNAPSRNGVPAHTQGAGFSFTITGLDSGTGYDLTLTAKDNSGNTIEETTIPFQTDYPEGIEDVLSDQVQSTKVIKDGQVLILRNGKTYTMQGQEVK